MSAASWNGPVGPPPGVVTGDNALWEHVTLRERDSDARHPKSSGNDSRFGREGNDPARLPPRPGEPLIGLPGAPQLRQELQHHIAQAIDPERGFALLYIDIDRFDRIREEVGDDGSSVVLARVAHRLRSSVRSIDTVARLDLNGFAALLAGTASPDVAACTARKIIAAVGRPIEAADSYVMVTASVGVALFGSDGCTIEDLTRAAAAAVASASRSGGRQVVLGAASRLRA